MVRVSKNNTLSIREVRLPMHEFATHVPHGRRELDVYITLAWHGREGVLDPKWTPSSSEGLKRGNKKKWKFRHQKWVCLDFKWTPHLDSSCVILEIE